MAPRTQELPPARGTRTHGGHYSLARRPAVLTPEAELDAARTMRRLRNRVWMRSLNAPGMAGQIMGLLRRHEDVLPPAVEAWARSARALKRRPGERSQDRFDDALEAASIALGVADPDRVLAVALREQIEQLMKGSTSELGRVDPTEIPEGYLQAIIADEEQWRRAKQDFVARNVGLALMAARRYTGHGPELSDLVHEGVLGVMKAADRFDPDRGFRFSTYATWWIRHAIERAMADRNRLVRVPVHLVTLGSKMKRARRQFIAKHGNEPTLEHLAHELGVTVEKAATVERLLHDPVVALEAATESGGSSLAESLTQRTPEIEQAIDSQRLQEELSVVLDRLRPFRREILEKRFGLGDNDPLTLQEIADQHALSRERIRQVQLQALEEARQHLDAGDEHTHQDAR